MPAFDDVGVEATPTSVVSASASAPPVVEPPPPPPPSKPVPDAKWLARFDHSPSFGFEHHPETDVAMTLTKLFIAPDAKAPDATAIAFAATVRARSLVVGQALPGCGAEWTDAHLLVATPDVRTAAHALLVRVAAAGTAPTPWSNGVYSGERVSVKRSGKVPWDDGGLLGILFHGDEVVLLRGAEFGNADGDCPTIADIWKKTLVKP